MVRPLDTEIVPTVWICCPSAPAAVRSRATAVTSPLLAASVSAAWLSALRSLATRWVTSVAAYILSRCSVVVGADPSE